jgi:hypothetical protein
MSYRSCIVAVLLCAAFACAPAEDTDGSAPAAGAKNSALAGKYTTVPLIADVSGFDDADRRLLELLIEAVQAMDDAFWKQAYGDKGKFLGSISDPALRQFALINYGPWDRLDSNAPFIDGTGPKSAGANFYPADVTKEEIENAADDALTSLYTMVRRDDDGALEAIPYSKFFEDEIAMAAHRLREAAAVAKDTSFKQYLLLRAEALETDVYQPSDMAWMDMQDNRFDVVIGPIETYEDQLLGAKAGFEGYVLIKDMEWSKRLARYAAFLPELQRGLPVPEAYRKETPGSDAELNAYDVVYYAGECNAGSKTIAINLPNDEEVQLAKGTRRLQLKNTMRAKFDRILVPIADELIAEDQRSHITFDAFFANTMFHEVAHGLGIKMTLDGSGTVRDALMEQTSGLEEGKADILGLYMITTLHDAGELPGAPLEDYYVTFLASTFRSVRFGASSAHGRANMMRFNFFKEMGAFAYDADGGVYRADFGKMREAIAAMSERILRFQGDGDYDDVREFAERMARVGPDLQSDLDRVNAAGIPTDIVFEQGAHVLGL